MYGPLSKGPPGQTGILLWGALWPACFFRVNNFNKKNGRMAESADAYALGAYGAIREGSSPSPSIF